MIFPSAYNRPPHVLQDEAIYSKYEPTYHEDIVDGLKVLVEDGVRNIYEAIQSHADDGDINGIVNRIALGYQYDFLPDGSYEDFADAPHTLAEAQSVIIGLKNEFNQLSPEVRASFGNSEEAYISSYGSTDWARIVGLIKDSPQEVNNNEPEQ